jgi:hypothetical protein
MTWPDPTGDSLQRLDAAERVLALALLVFLLVVPVVTAVFLAVRARPLAA